MEGFTPAFFLQLLIAVGTAGAVYGAIKADLRNMHRQLEELKGDFKDHVKSDDETHHELRQADQAALGRVSTIEGRLDR